MGTFFLGEGNLGSNAEFRVFPSGNDEPRSMMRLNVRFDNPIPGKDGYQDRGGFWAPVEIWYKDAEHWAKAIYQRGMRVMVQGNMLSQEWTDEEGRTRTIMKVEARRIAILPQRVLSITLADKPSSDSESPPEPEDTPEVAGNSVKKAKTGKSAKQE